jgi:hypothetical protein
MATFVANTPVDMDTLSDFAILTAPATTWAGSLASFTATSSFGSVVINGDGIFNGSGGKPTGGDIDSLTVTYGGLIPTGAYQISGLGLAVDFR